MTVPMSRPEPVVACCGSSVYGWDPKNTSSMKRQFELSHKGQVSACGWLNSRALATAGAECVVNVYALPAGTKAATVPNLQDLPPDCSAITCLAVLNRGSVACGHKDGSIDVVHLTGKQVCCALVKAARSLHSQLLCGARKACQWG
jgi:hypothetical protein